MSDGSSPSVIETGAEGDEVLSEGSEDEDMHDEDDDEDGAPEEDVKDQLSSISFGTLKKAQDSMSRKRKRGSDTNGEQEDKLAALRARLQELREAKGSKTGKDQSKKESSKQQRGGDTSGSDEDSDEDSDSGPEEVGKSRSSKHAPMSQPSNRQVTRKRTVIVMPKRQVRDPRFAALPGQRTDDAATARRYAFLNEYAESEMAELKAAIRKTKDEEDKEVLKRKLLSMQSKKKAQETKERQQAVIREHRKKEKEAIKEGKNPYFLKRSEQKKLADVAKFNSMKGKDREKLMERRRKKVDAKEKKMMPSERRVVG